MDSVLLPVKTVTHNRIVLVCIVVVPHGEVVIVVRTGVGSLSLRIVNRTVYHLLVHENSREETQVVVCLVVTVLVVFRRNRLEHF